jgi:parallel beta-helix repeat protein
LSGERGQNLKRKIFSIVFALLLALGLGLALPVPTGAIGGSPVTLYSETALDGLIIHEDGANSGESINVGDYYTDHEYYFRGFVSFDISSFPLWAVIDSATLRMYQYSTTGTPYTDLGDLIVDHLNYGDTLDSDDFDLAALQDDIGTLSTDDTVEWKELDVTDSFQNDFDNLRTHSQYRLRFSPLEINNNEVSDCVYLESADNFGTTGNIPELVIAYSHPDEVWVATTGDDDNPGTETEPFATIGQGIGIVADGGTVNVEAGEYDETDIVIDKSLTLQSVSGDWHDTIIDDTISPIFAFSEFDGDAVISGLTINGGDYGIYINGLGADGSITVSNCRIYEAGNAGILGTGTDGGLEGDIYIDNCVIDDNAAGIWLRFMSGTVEITDSAIGGYWDAETETRYEGNTGSGIELDEVEATGSVLIDNNIITDNDNYGIYVPGDTVDGELTITNNIIGAYAFDLTEENALFSGNGDWGIYIEYVTADGVVTIEDNKLAENAAGIRIETNRGESTISNNYVGSWMQDIPTFTYDGNDGPGVIVDNTLEGSLLIQGNNISKNGYTGLHVAHNDGGTGAVTIDSNTIDDNGTGGYGNYLNDIEYAIISNNTITLHTSEESPYSGLYLASSSGNTIRGNTINENDYGIYIDVTSVENLVCNNTIQDNNIDGIFIEGDGNYIAGNTISNNQGGLLCGIQLTSDASGNGINYNNITGNTPEEGGSFGVLNNNDSTEVDATYNWWGDASGPYNETSNPDANGDAVSDHVDYDPWLGQEWTGEVWVDDDWEGSSPGDAVGGHTFGIDAFAYIQDAVDAVPPYTTINVAAGVYFEGPTLEDPEDFSDYDYLADVWIYEDGLTLQAENPAAGLEDPMENPLASVIVASGESEDVVNIAANNVTFDGFLVYGAEYDADCGVNIYDWWEEELYSDCTVTNNYITENNLAGVLLQGTGHNISDNIIYDNWASIALDVGEGSPVTITGNELRYCENCIYCPAATMDGGSVTIEDNEIYDAQDGIWFDLITGGSELTIQGNDINENYYCGIYIDTIEDSSELSIQGNNIHDNGYSGIFLDTINDSTVTIGGNGEGEANIISDNGDEGEGEDAYPGILILDTNNATVTIQGNTLDDNATDGICFYSPDTVNNSTILIENNEISGSWFGTYFETIVGSEVNILNNTINENEEGICLEAVDADSTVTIGGNTITNNVAEDDGAPPSGIDLDEGVDVTSVSVHFNNIYGNLDYGICNASEGEGTLDARWNWWNTTTGPYEETANPAGEGDEVSGDIDFEPWLTAPVTGFANQNGASGAFDGTGETGGWVNITGTADAYLAQYGSNPGPGSSFSGGTGHYIDVMILNPVGVTEIEIRLYSTDAEVACAGVFESTLRLKWWDSDSASWVACSDSGINTTNIVTPPPAGAPYSGYMWAKIRTDTTPPLGELTGTPFGGGGAVGGGGGGGGFDNTAPTISDILHCYSGITDTTADICWTTNEPSTSQIKYWASPSMLSPLDARYVTKHHVQLTGLTPNTTYHYQIMSRDSAYNLAISDEYTFTTLEEAPAPGEASAAAFTSSDLSVSPNEVSTGETVTITLSVANTSGTEGSYNVVLKINGVEETEQSVTLAADSSQDVSFSVSREEAGSYSVEVNGLTGSFTVVAPASPAEETPPAPAATGFWIWVIVGVVVVGLAIFFAVRRRA